MSDVFPFRPCNLTGEIQPYGDQLLVRVISEETEHHGLLIPETARRPGSRGGSKYLRTGIVLAAGPGDPCRCTAVRAGEESQPDPACRRCGGSGRLPMHAGPGDRILYDHPSNRELKSGEELRVILHEEQHVLAVLD